jgi:hypothetical protein
MHHKRYKEMAFAAFFDLSGFYAGATPPLIAATPQILETVSDSCTVVTHAPW